MQKVASKTKSTLIDNSKAMPLDGAGQGDVEIKPCTSCFKSLGIDSRMDIYSFLKKMGSASVTTITSRVKLTQPTVSYHLHQMQTQGLLTSVKRGKEVLYSINFACPVYKKECVLKHVNLTNES